MALTPDDLVYSATARCTCGAGLAHPKTASTNGCWDCSEILLGTARRDVKHIARLPFIFYKVSSENHPSALRATTRPVLAGAPL